MLQHRIHSILPVLFTFSWLCQSFQQEQKIEEENHPISSKLIGQHPLLSFNPAFSSRKYPTFSPQDIHLAKKDASPVMNGPTIQLTRQYLKRSKFNTYQSQNEDVSAVYNRLVSVDMENAYTLFTSASRATGDGGLSLTFQYDYNPHPIIHMNLQGTQANGNRGILSQMRFEILSVTEYNASTPLTSNATNQLRFDGPSALTFQNAEVYFRRNTEGIRFFVMEAIYMTPTFDILLIELTLPEQPADLLVYQFTAHYPASPEGIVITASAFFPSQLSQSSIAFEFAVSNDDSNDQVNPQYYFGNPFTLADVNDTRYLRPFSSSLSLPTPQQWQFPSVSNSTSFLPCSQSTAGTYCARFYKSFQNYASNNTEIAVIMGAEMAVDLVESAANLASVKLQSSALKMESLLWIFTIPLFLSNILVMS